MSNSSDNLDRAADLTRMYTDDAIREAAYRVRPQQVQNADGTWPHPECTDCDNEIPMARLQMGRIRCIYCQERIEKKVGL